MNKNELETASKINGEVRISLDTYHKLIAQHVVAEDKRLIFEDATKAVGDFLTSMRSNEDVNFPKVMKEFNETSNKLRIYIDDSGRVRMGLKRDMEEG